MGHMGWLLCIRLLDILSTVTFTSQRLLLTNTTEPKCEHTTNAAIDTA